MVFCCILQCFVAKSVFLQVTLFCREICFCTIYVVLRGEKLSKKLYPWRKNDKYEVCPNAPFCRENAEWGFEVHLPAAQWKPLKSLYFLLSPQPLAKSSLTSENKDRWWKAPSTNSRCSRFDNMAFIGWGPRVWVEMWWEAAVVEVLERMPREHLHNFMSWTWAGFLPVTFCFAPLLLSQSTALSSAPSTWY